MLPAVILEGPHDGLVFVALAIVDVVTVWPVSGVGGEAVLVVEWYGDGAELIRFGVIRNPLSCGSLGQSVVVVWHETCAHAAGTELGSFSAFWALGWWCAVEYPCLRLFWVAVWARFC